MGRVQRRHDPVPRIGIRSIRRLTWTVVLFAGVSTPGVLEAQWVEDPGTGWLALAVYHQDTREEYRSDGEVREIFPRLELPANLRTAWARMLKIEAPVG